MTAPELSLCVGVTGHRDIDKAALLARVALEFDHELIAPLPHAHWVVLHRQRPFEVKMGG